MRAISLLYHDVVEGEDSGASGFPGGAAAVYKLERREFVDHLAAIAGAVDRATTVHQLLAGDLDATPLLLTFDDGGVSAYSCIADLLEGHGWRGHFFITGNRIGTAGFVTREQIQSLHARGHVIGSHSWSHPTRMTKCPWDELVQEWATSAKVLSEILGEPVRLASVPSGFYSRRVAEAAASAGIQALFTSEPTTRCHVVAGCAVLGRFGLWRGAPAAQAAGLASGAWTPRLRQFVSWQLKKVLKGLGGPVYAAVRSRLLDRSGSSPP
jgi:peptidoglycan/xylan/chitin deacetylase (PgdA/CDA1 family)